MLDEDLRHLERSDDPMDKVKHLLTLLRDEKIYPIDIYTLAHCDYQPAKNLISQDLNWQQQFELQENQIKECIKNIFLNDDEFWVFAQSRNNLIEQIFYRESGHQVLLEELTYPQVIAIIYKIFPG